MSGQLSHLPSDRPDAESDEAPGEALEDEAGMTRLHAHVPKALLRDIKMIAAQGNLTVSGIVRDCLVEYRRNHADG